MRHCRNSIPQADLLGATHRRLLCRWHCTAGLLGAEQVAEDDRYQVTMNATPRAALEVIQPQILFRFAERSFTCQRSKQRYGTMVSPLALSVGASQPLSLVVLRSLALVNMLSLRWSAAKFTIGRPRLRGMWVGIRASIFHASIFHVYRNPGLKGDSLKCSLQRRKVDTLPTSTPIRAASVCRPRNPRLQKRSASLRRRSTR